MTSTWTAERITRLAALWRQGASADQIAKTLGGTTRDAVIGKVHRLGLVQRMNPSAPAPRPKRPAAVRRPRAVVAARPPPPPFAPTVEMVRDAAAQAYGLATGELWQPWRGSVKASRLTAA